MDIGTALIGGASAVMAIGLTVLIAWVLIGVSEYFWLEQRLKAEAQRQQDAFTGEDEGIDAFAPGTFHTDDLIRQYDRMEDE